jgi:signal transduction histidine kinase
MTFNFLRIVIYIASLMGLAAIATLNAQSPRGIVSCGLAALLIAEFLRRALLKLRQHDQPPAQEIPVGLPHNHQTQSDNFIQLEARLEHAPIALFLSTPGHDHIEPLNNFSRRMMAPGRTTDINDFNAKLAATGDAQRNVITFDTERGQERALVAVNDILINGLEQRLIAVLPIESELETVAFNAWQQLVHVLTHEIMNSLTPVASLSRTAHDLLAEMGSTNDADTAHEISNDLSTALDAISRRSDSLVGFVSSYRSLTNVPAPHPERIQLAQLFARISALLTPNWQAKGGSISFTVEPVTLEIMIDGGQLEQAIINIIKNAEEATVNKANQLVTVHARLTRGSRLRIEINDNGPGVPDDLIPHIFTPFFTTKIKGSGIGLAMVRQLVHSNGGTVRYVKIANTGARFILTF